MQSSEQGDVSFYRQNYCIKAIFTPDHSHLHNQKCWQNSFSTEWKINCVL